MAANRPDLRVRQVFSACTFCKTRKIKVGRTRPLLIQCDGIVPSCGGCTKFGRSTSCSLFTGGVAQHGTDYPTYLLDRVAKLQAQLRNIQKSEGFLASKAGPIEALIADIGALPILASSYPTSIEGPSLSTVILAAASRRVLDIEPQMESPYLPVLNTAIKLVEYYVQDIYPRLPFFSLQGLWAQFAQVFSTAPTVSHGDEDSALNQNYGYFTVLLVLAISTSTLSRSTDSVISGQSLRLFLEALRFRESAILPNTIVGVQSLLFLIQYATLNPSVLDAWYLIGVAMRTCINLGLHEDPPIDSISPSLLETRRRLWWSVYSFDRSMSIGCGRATEISDDVIGARLPSFRIESNASDADVQGYLQRYRALQLQSRIYDKLDREDQSTSIIDQLGLELAEWKLGNAEGNILLESEWLIGNVLLYRPCRLAPLRNKEDLEHLWTSATGFITLYRQLVEVNNIYYTQIACEKAYWIGIAILYSFWKLPKQTVRSVDLWMAVNNVLFVLRTLSERWEEGKRLTEEFEKVSSIAIQLFEQPLVNLEVQLSWQIVDFGHYSSLAKILNTVYEPSLAAPPSKEQLQELIYAL